MDITYRPAKQEDLEEAERVAQQSGNALRVRHGGQPSPAPPSTAFPKFCLARDPSGLWVAEVGDTIVGFGFSWMTEKFWCLSQLFVRPETQAKGIGQALLSKTLMQAERNGAANRALITFGYNIASTGLYLQNDLYPREPLYQMAGPAQAVAQNLVDAGYDITPIAPWPESGEWIGRIDQELLGYRRDLRLRGARGADRARGPRRRLCLYLRPGSCRSAGNRTGRRCEGGRDNGAALCAGGRRQASLDDRSGTGGNHYANGVGTRLPHRRALSADGVAAFRQLVQLSAEEPGFSVDPPPRSSLDRSGVARISTRKKRLPDHRVIGRRQGDVLTGGMQNSQVREIRFDLAVAQSRR